MAPSTVHDLTRVSEYAVVERLDESPTTRVYRVLDDRDGSSKVLKLCQQERASGAVLRDLRREFEVLRSIESPFVVRCLGWLDSDEYVGLILEDIKAAPLSQLVLEGSPCLGQRLAIARKLTQALHSIHSAGFVHKDVNPSNVLTDADATDLKLVDFGISTALRRGQVTPTPARSIQGTLGYIAPEQTGRMNRPLDHRADLYALGITLYELFTGRRPFVSEDPTELVHAHLAVDPRPAAEVNPELPKVLSDVFGKLLRKDADDRYYSAAGVSADLDRCLRSLADTGAVADFTVAAQDVSDTLQIPQCLYGREEELSHLLEEFEESLVAGPRFVTVAGYSGIGKSSLVHELYKPLAEHMGFFAIGKFEQYKRNVPYSAVTAAFSGLVRQLLSSGDETFQEWKLRLANALGKDAQVIVDVVPVLGHLLDKRPLQSALGAPAAQTRFNSTFRKFVRAICSTSKPLVVFFDDLQWADAGSLKLLEVLLTDKHANRLLIVGSYRDNEVGPSHLLSLTLADLKRKQVKPRSLTLKPLEQQHIQKLLQRTLQLDPDTLLPLTQLVKAKTDGNPFFVLQFLLKAKESGHLWFEPGTDSPGVWRFNHRGMQDLDSTDNVLELMESRLRQLPEETQSVLRLAGCVGGTFSLETLALAFSTSIKSCFSHLGPALSEGFVLATSEPEVDLSDASRSLVVRHFKFLHDRVQQAAYDLIPEEDRAKTHLQLGRRLLAQVDEAPGKSNLFELVEHLNAAQALLHVPAEKLELARLNLVVARRAKDSLAYDSALNYLRVGSHLLSDQDNAANYSLWYQLSLAQADAEFLAGNMDQARQLAGAVEARAKSTLDQARVKELRILLFLSEQRVDEAIEVALDVLAQLGVHIPTDPAEIEVRTEELRRSLGTRPAELQALAEAAEVVDETTLLAIRILTRICSSTYIGNPVLWPLVVLTNADLCIRHGRSPQSASVYIWCAGLLCGAFQDMEPGFAFGKLGLRILDNHPRPEDTAQVYNKFLVFVSPWREHVRTATAMLPLAVNGGIAHGDIEYSFYAAAHRCSYRLFSGEPLPQLQTDMKEALSRVQAHIPPPVLLRTGFHESLVRIFLQAASNLLGGANDPKVLVGDHLNETISLNAWKTRDFGFLQFCAFGQKTMLSCLFGDYEQAILAGKEALNYRSSVVGTLYYSEQTFYYAIALLASLTETTSAQSLARVSLARKGHERLQHWAESCPENFAHLKLLVEAELKRVNGKYSDALELSAQALHMAREGRFTHLYAFICERRAVLFGLVEQDAQRQEALHNAYTGYRAWGATAKLAALRDEHPELQLGTSRGTPDSSDNTKIQQTTLDVRSLAKAAQAISGEIVLEKLFSRLIRIVLENAGAQRGVLLLDRQGELVVEAEGEECGQQVTTTDSLPLESIQRPLLARSIVRYVHRSRETVVLGDASTSERFAQDEYVVWKRPRSLLVLPIINAGALVGILYLENNSAAEMFNAERLSSVELLAAQIAISVTNARLYAGMESVVRERTRQLEEAHTRILRFEKESLEQRMAGGFAHEMRNALAAASLSAEVAAGGDELLTEKMAKTVEQIFKTISPFVTDSEWDNVIELFRAFEKDNQTLSDILNMVTQSVRRANLITGLILDYSRLGKTEAGEDQVTIRSVLESVVQSQTLEATGSGVSIRLRLEADQCILGKEPQLFSIFNNLVKNGREALEEQAGQKEKWLEIFHGEVDGKPIVRVQDNGPGISAANREKIFEPFYSTKPTTGCGLGLSFVRKLVLLYGGSIGVSSEPGTGTTFTVAFPDSASQAPQRARL